jgi:hypothetical protein
MWIHWLSVMGASFVDDIADTPRDPKTKSGLCQAYVYTARPENKPRPKPKSGVPSYTARPENKPRATRKQKATVSKELQKRKSKRNDRFATQHQRNTQGWRRREAERPHASRSRRRRPHKNLLPPPSGRLCETASTKSGGRPDWRKTPTA